jgi:flavin reductase (DIM6/NTAB) family NADH-FMN oxidoreductase RutF
MSAQQLRKALGVFATGVTIISTLNEQGEAVGFTANSFNSLSLDPPLILWSLGLKAGSLSAFLKAQHHAISVLCAEQQELALRFAQKDAHRWQDVSWTPGLHGMPLIAGAIATFECQAHQHLTLGDHELFIGQVLRCHFQENAKPLIFHGGKFFTELPLHASTV